MTKLYYLLLLLLLQTACSGHESPNHPIRAEEKFMTQPQIIELQEKFGGISITFSLSQHQGSVSDRYSKLLEVINTRKLNPRPEIFSTYDLSGDSGDFQGILHVPNHLKVGANNWFVLCAPQSPSDKLVGYCWLYGEYRNTYFYEFEFLASDLREIERANGHIVKSLEN